MSCGVVGTSDANSASAIIAMALKGSQVLKIDGYSRTKGLGNGKFIKSEPFDIGGHLWCIMYSWPFGPGTTSWLKHDTNQHGPGMARPDGLRASAWHGPALVPCLGHHSGP